jgi:hypothetical protein
MFSAAGKIDDKIEKNSLRIIASSGNNHSGIFHVMTLPSKDSTLVTVSS